MFGDSVAGICRAFANSGEDEKTFLAAFSPQKLFNILFGGF